MPLASEVLSGEGSQPPLIESDIRTSCPECQAHQALDRATVDDFDALEVVYTCRKGCGPILIVSTSGVVPWEDRGYRVGDWLLRDPTDLYIEPPYGEGAVLIPASPHALD